MLHGKNQTVYGDCLALSDEFVSKFVNKKSGADSPAYYEGWDAAGELVLKEGIDRYLDVDIAKGDPRIDNIISGFTKDYSDLYSKADFTDGFYERLDSFIMEYSPEERAFINKFSKKYDKEVIATATNKYVVTTGIFEGHIFNGHPVVISGENRIWDDDSIGRSYPIENTKVLSETTEASIKISSKQELPKLGYTSVAPGIYVCSKHHLWQLSRDGEGYVIERTADEEAMRKAKETKIASRKTATIYRVEQTFTIPGFEHIPFSPNEEIETYKSSVPSDKYQTSIIQDMLGREVPVTDTTLSNLITNRYITKISAISTESKFYDEFDRPIGNTTYTGSWENKGGYIAVDTYDDDVKSDLIKRNFEQIKQNTFYKKYDGFLPNKKTEYLEDVEILDAIIRENRSKFMSKASSRLITKSDMPLDDFLLDLDQNAIYYQKGKSTTDTESGKLVTNFEVEDRDLDTFKTIASDYGIILEATKKVLTANNVDSIFNQAYSEGQKAITAQFNSGLITKDKLHEWSSYPERMSSFISDIVFDASTEFEKISPKNKENKLIDAYESGYRLGARDSIKNLINRFLEEDTRYRGLNPIFLNPKDAKSAGIEESKKVFSDEAIIRGISLLINMGFTKNEAIKEFIASNELDKEYKKSIEDILDKYKI